MAALVTECETIRVPIPLAPLVGRQRQLAEIGGLLTREQTRLVTLTGPGGVGKTRLAIHVALATGDAFPDGAAFVDLAAITDVNHVVSAVAQAVGLKELQRDGLEARIAHYLSGRAMLLVLDNFEQVLAAATFVAGLLRTTPSVKALVTSRLPLHVSGEHEYAVPPLELGAQDKASGNGDAGSEALQLFVARAQAVRSDFTLSPEDAPVVEQICRRLDGLPLAIELASVRLKVLPPSALLTRLERRLPLLTAAGRDLPARQRTMRDAIAWSHDLLSPDERVLFRRLAVFSGGFTLDEAEAVVLSDDFALDPLDGVTELIDASLLTQDIEHDGTARYRMLEMIREFGLEQLAASGDEDRVRDAHARTFVQLAEEIATALPWHRDPASAIGRLNVNLDNLRAALSWTLDNGDTTTFVTLAAALEPFWMFSGRLGEGRVWTDRALEYIDAVPPKTRLQALNSAARIARSTGDRERSHALAEEAFALARQCDDPRYESDLYLLQGLLAEDEADFEASRSFHERAFAVARESNDAMRAALALQFAGWQQLLCGDLDGSKQRFEEALAVFRSAPEGSLGIALTQSNLAEIARLRGEFTHAAELWQDRLRLTWDTWGLRWSLEGLATIALDCGEFGRGALLLGAAEAQRERCDTALTPRQLPDYEHDVARARAALGNQAFVEAWNEGRRISLAAACAEAALVGETLRSVLANDVTIDRLSPREREILHLIVEGRSNPEIADHLYISLRTVTTHVSNILGKLGVASRTEAAACAVRDGLV